MRKQSPETLLRDGLVMVPEGRDLLPNDGAGKPADGSPGSRRDTVTVRREMNRIFERFPRLGERQHQLAGLLSGGEQQLLALNRALLSRPRTADPRRTLDGPRAEDG